MRRILQWIILFVTLLALSAAYLAWETDRNMVRRWIYPVRGLAASWSTHCDAAAPQWLAGTVAAMARTYGSPANQVAFISAEGNEGACVNGWSALPLLSERLTAETRMRLASLSKIVSFIGMTQGHGSQEAWRQWLSQPLAKLMQVEGPYKDSRVADIRIGQLLNHSAGFDRLKAEDTMVIRDKKPWCPYQMETLRAQVLQYTPGTAYAYGNIDFCLAAAAYEQSTGHSLWQVLDHDLQLGRYGLAYLKDADSSVRYNFMNQGFYDGDFPRYFDWSALRAPMGMTGNAMGLARFIHQHRDALALALAMHDDHIPCDAANPEKPCFDGFLERREVQGKTLWMQRGYLFGMSAIFLMDEPGNLLVWLGAGESSPLAAAGKRWTVDFAQHIQ